MILEAKSAWTNFARLYFFFFQAEDGIRDRNVTGVQTCALPISRRGRPAGHDQPPPRRRPRQDPAHRAPRRQPARRARVPRRRLAAQLVQRHARQAGSRQADLRAHPLPGRRRRQRLALSAAPRPQHRRRHPQGLASLRRQLRAVGTDRAGALAVIALFFALALPLVEVPVSAPGGQFAVVVSGDGGWRKIDASLADRLRQRGIPTVGLDSAAYYRTRRTPEESAAALEAILREYSAKWQRPKAIVIGFSRGADVLPFMINRLPADVRSTISAIAILGPEPLIDFRFHPWW